MQIFAADGEYFGNITTFERGRMLRNFSQKFLNMYN